MLLWHLFTSYFGSAHRKILLFIDTGAAPTNLVESPARFRFGGAEDLSCLDSVMHSFSSAGQILRFMRVGSVWAYSYRAFTVETCRGLNAFPSELATAAWSM